MRIVLSGEGIVGQANVSCGSGPAEYGEERPWLRLVLRRTGTAKVLWDKPVAAWRPVMQGGVRQSIGMVPHSLAPRRQCTAGQGGVQLRHSAAMRVQRWQSDVPLGHGRATQRRA